MMWNARISLLQGEKHIMDNQISNENGEHQGQYENRIKREKIKMKIISNFKGKK